jgi:hypothetical protein
MAKIGNILEKNKGIRYFYLTPKKRVADYPNPRQRAFFESRARHTAYGGARGGGKKLGHAKKARSARTSL